MVGMITKIFVVTNDSAEFEQFLSNNSSIDGAKFSCVQGNAASLSEIISSSADPILIMNTSVVLPLNYLEMVAALLGILSSEWPNWGIVGDSGRTFDGVGLSATNHISYSTGTNSLPSFSDSTYPCIDLDSGVILVNPKSLPILVESDFHKHGDFAKTLSSICKTNNRGCLVDSKLAVYYRRHPPRIEKKFSMERFSHLDQQSALERAGVGKRVPRLTIVTRTQFRNMGMLSRAMSSVQRFREVQKSVEIKHLIISERPLPDKFIFENSVDYYSSSTDLQDSRFALIAEASHLITSGFVLFLDDDDWLTIDSDLDLGPYLQAYSDTNVLHFSSSYFYENGHQLKQGLSVAAVSAISNLEFFNRTPFCSIIWPSSFLRLISAESTRLITLLEDMYLILNSWSRGLTPVLIEREIAGVSIRPNENTSNSVSRASWLTGRANLASALVNEKGSRMDFTLQRNSGRGTKFQIIRLFYVLRELPLVVIHANKLGVTRQIFEGKIGYREFIVKVRATFKF
jgi:hypothetical protein